MRVLTCVRARPCAQAALPKGTGVACAVLREAGAMMPFPGEQAAAALLALEIADQVMVRGMHACMHCGAGALHGDHYSAARNLHTARPGQAIRLVRWRPCAHALGTLEGRGG